MASIEEELGIDRDADQDESPVRRFVREARERAEAEDPRASLDDSGPHRVIDGAPDEGEGRGVLVRNMLVATATVPFAFLLVLILAVFVFGSPANQAPQVASTSTSFRVAVDDDEVRDAVAPAKTDAPVWAAKATMDFAVNPPVKGDIQSVGLDGERVALLVRGEDGEQSIVIYHVARGEVLANIPFRDGGLVIEDALTAGGEDTSRMQDELIDVPAGQSPRLKSSLGGPATN